MLLTPRQAQIFQTIVEDYIDFAEPVGSRTISKKFNNSVSSATIRNEMSDLEEMGLISQPHLSSGRVPTQKGFRFYIDCMLEIDRLSKEEADMIDNIKRDYAQKKQHIRNLMKDVSRTISNIVEYPSVIIAPKLSSEKFRKIQFLALGEAEVHITVVTVTGLIEHFSLSLDFMADQTKLDAVARQLNSVPGGFTMKDASAAIMAEFGIDKDSNVLGSSISDYEDDNIDDRIFLNGSENIFKKPEFQNSQMVKRFIEMFNNKENFLKLLDTQKCKSKDDVIIMIGNEFFEVRDLDLGLVASEYRDSRNATGVLGIIGPSRMEYGRIVSFVREMANKLGDLLNEGSGRDVNSRH